MANTASALKRVRQTKTRTVRNKAAKSRLKTARRAVTDALAKGDKAAVDTALKTATSITARSAKAGLIHKNKAARVQSRLAKAANKAGA